MKATCQNRRYFIHNIASALSAAFTLGWMGVNRKPYYTAPKIKNFRMEFPEKS